MSTLNNFRAVGAAAARLLADMLDGPELGGHDYDMPMADPERVGRFEFQAYTDESSRAEGTQRAQAPGEVSADPSPDPAPSPGELSQMPDSELLTLAMQVANGLALHASMVMQIEYLMNLADALRDRAAQFEAAESDSEHPVDAYYCGDCGVLNLTPHLETSHGELAERIAAIRANWTRQHPQALTLSEEIASSLLATFRITRK